MLVKRFHVSTFLKCILVRSWDTISSNTVKNCFRKESISQETQVANIKDEDYLFKILAENVNEQGRIQD